MYVRVERASLETGYQAVGIMGLGLGCVLCVVRGFGNVEALVATALATMGTLAWYAMFVGNLRLAYDAPPQRDWPMLRSVLPWAAGWATLSAFWPSLSYSHVPLLDNVMIGAAELLLYVRCTRKLSNVWALWVAVIAAMGLGWQLTGG